MLEHFSQWVLRARGNVSAAGQTIALLHIELVSAREQTTASCGISTTPPRATTIWHHPGTAQLLRWDRQCDKNVTREKSITTLQRFRNAWQIRPVQEAIVFQQGHKRHRGKARRKKPFTLTCVRNRRTQTRVSLTHHVDRQTNRESSSEPALSQYMRPSVGKTVQQTNFLSTLFRFSCAPVTCKPNNTRLKKYHLWVKCGRLVSLSL